MSSSTMTTWPYFEKKKFNEFIFTYLNLKEPLNKKSRHRIFLIVIKLLFNSYMFLFI